MKASLAVLMYHAVVESAEALPGADAHYSVSPASFRRHLQLIGDAGALPESVAATLAAKARPNSVLLTFDDGHESNAAAAEAILACGGTADLFINPSTVGQRGYLDWRTLRELAGNGISIQSHGQTHRYLDDLSEAAIGLELSDSKRAIEDQVGHPVTLFAPPGGRLPPSTARLARAAGYVGICSSKPGVWLRTDGAWEIPRFALLASTSDEQLARWIRQEPGELARLRFRGALLGLAKRTLGNRAYETVRAQALRVQRRKSVSK